MADPITFEEARDESTKEREEEGEEPFYSEESDVVPDEEDLEERTRRIRTILATSPDELGTRGEIVPGHADISPLRDVLNGIISFEEISSELEVSQSQAELLRNIAKSNISIMETVKVLADTQVLMLEEMFSVVDFMSPFTNITVSGTNSIEDANSAEPVVPQSDTTDIPTRILFIKASENNDNPIAIGDDETEPANGWILHPNEHLSLNINLSNQVLYMASSESDETVELLGLL